jgi:formiminotetrahydrofolate cyclodeaminase
MTYPLEIFQERLNAVARKDTGDAFRVHKRNTKMRKKTVEEQENRDKEEDELVEIFGAMSI